MATHKYFNFHVVLHALVLTALATTASSSSNELSPKFYEKSCPMALKTIEQVVQAAVYKERRMGASLLRMHFHDCFVNGCDGSVLLDPSATIDSEKNALPNVNSLRGFEVIDSIKKEVDDACGPIVSCADILAVAARDSVVALGGSTWRVQLGRRDSKTASRTTANADIPRPAMDLPQLIASFKKQGLNKKDLVVLSGGHTIGFSRCVSFRDHIYNDSNIDPKFASALKKGTCPRIGGDNNLAPLDPTTYRFDEAYFSSLVQKRGLLHSDQELYFHGGYTDELVKKYSYDTKAFFQDFAKSMIKMGNIKPLTGKQGEVRLNCRKVN